MATSNRTKAAATAAATEEPKVSTAVETPTKPIVAKEIDPSDYVIVRNGFNGKLVYVSPRTGEKFIWQELGDELEMELRELRSAKTRYKRFFADNWFMFDDDWVPEYLGVGRYYKNALKIDAFDDVFEKKPAEIKKIVEGLSDGQKRSLGYMAREKIANKEIDSLRVINTLEECLGIELIEK